LFEGWKTIYEQILIPEDEIFITLVISLFKIHKLVNVTSVIH